MRGTRIQCITYLAGIKDEKPQYEVKEVRAKRSLQANSYYWLLVGELARVLKISSAKIHNMNLRHLGFVERIGDKLVTVSLPDTDTAERQVIESETYHLKPTSQVRQGRDGELYRTYVMLRGSHTFNTQEMAALIDLVVQDANAQGIETITPREREELIARYGKEKKHHTE